MFFLNFCYNPFSLFFQKQLNQMDFSDLLKKIKSNDEYYANLAAQSLRHRIGQRQIIINNHILPNENKDMFISGNKFVIRNTTTALDYLQHFGSDIWSLEIEFVNGDKKDVRKVMKYVDRYCSESLVELKMTVWYGKTPLITRHPFQNLKELVLINRSVDGQTSLPTNLSFPALESLHLEVFKFAVTDSNNLFPNLVELSAYVNDKSTEDAINNLIDMNPHIRKLELTRTSSEFLQKVSEKLQLESLNIGVMDSSNDRIRIENLKEFTTPRHSCNFMNYDFPNLKILNVFHEAMPVNKLTEFLDKHRNLTGFNVIHRTMFDDEFVSITSLLPELIDVSVIDTTRSPMNTNSIVTFIENHVKLMKFYVNECDQNDKPFLRKQLGSDWKIEDYENGLLFERAQQSMFNKLFSKIGLY